jgi:hypothetical protein
MFSPRRIAHAGRPTKPARRARIAVEELEPRNLLSVFTPAQIRHAYGFDQVMFGGVKGDGAGQTIAIVDAYDDSKIASDLHVFDQTFGLFDPLLTKATPQGHPGTNSGWALEISLDVEWAHAIAPGANLLLVEAKSASFSNLLGAVNYARSQPGVAAVSMSWGEDELFLNSTFETSNDGFFTTPSGHSGVTFVAASGDDGGQYGPGWPAISPNVLAVGGTSLFLDSSGNYSSESGWSGSSGGVSFFEPEPRYQRGVQSTGFRTNPDVSIVGDPNTGVYVYTTVSQRGSIGWFQVGGTSVGAPIWSALVAIADQGRALEGTTTATKAALDGAHDTLPALYSFSSSDFNDVTTGSNAVASAGKGYDLVTGLGTPKAALVIADLVKVSASSVHTTTVTSGGGGGGSGTRHAALASAGGQANPNQADTSLAIALANSATRSFFPARAISTAAVVATPPTVTVITSVAPLTNSSVATSVLLGGDTAVIEDATGAAPADYNIEVVPPAPADAGKPAGPAVPASPAPPDSTRPSPPVFDEPYDAASTDERWTAAFADSDGVLTPSRIEEAGANDVTTSVAVALGGIWIALAGKPDQRKRPEPAR